MFPFNDEFYGDTALLSGQRVRYSVLDLVPICVGSTAAVAFRNMLELAQDAERLGYHRYWVAEHHNVAGLASAATAVVINYIASRTHQIRVGAGGIMLPNHAPLIIAEQFGTLEVLYPGRIDLGIGRSPGSDISTINALRQGGKRNINTFPIDLQELRDYFQPTMSKQVVRAIPGEGINVPLYLLGSSDFSARLAAQMGLPFAFAAHFAPRSLHDGLCIYRREFRASENLGQPYVMVSVNIFAADTDLEAHRLATSLQQRLLALIRGVPEELQMPQERMDGRWLQSEQAQIEYMMSYTAIGAPSTVRRKLRMMIDETGADEMIMTSMIHDHAARRHSLSIAAAVMREINAERKQA